MRHKKNLMIGVIVLLLMVNVAGCVAQATVVPARAVEISMDEALNAQNKLADLMMGQVEWTESEFSSLLSVLLEQNSGENNPIDSVHVWFEPDNEVVIRVIFAGEIAPMVNSLDIAGTVSIENNHVVVDVQQAGTGNISLTGEMLPAINEQINGALADPAMGVAADVETETGLIRLSMGM